MVLAYVLATVYGDTIKVAEELTEIQELSNIHIIYGEYDLIMTVKSPSLIHLRETLLKKIEKMEGVGKTTTFIVADRTKESDNVVQM